MTEKIIKLWNKGTSLENIAKQFDMTIDMAGRLLVKAMIWRQD